MRRGDWASAATHWLAVAKKFKNHTPPRVFEKLSYAYRHDKKFSEAQAVIEDGISRYPDQFSLYIEQAEVAMAQGQWETAVQLWESVKEKTIPDTPEKVYAKLARAYRYLGKLKNAEHITKQGTKAYPKSDALQIEGAKLAFVREDWPTAISLWKKVIDEPANGASVQAYVQLVRSLRRIGDDVLAEKYANQGAQKFTTAWELSVELAEIVTTRKNWPEALRAWQRLLSAYRKQPDISPSVVQNARFNESIIKRLIDTDSYRCTIKEFQKAKRATKRIAIYTSVSKGYDRLKPHEVIDNRFDYFAFTDEKLDSMGIYDIRPIPVTGYDDGRAIRYSKTHPHVLFPDYDIAIWLDTSLMIVGNLYPIIEEFIKSGKAIGSSPHSQRRSVYEEFQTCIELHKDDIKTIKRQMDFYKSMGFDTNELTENGFLMFNLKHPKLAPTLETWWEQICQFSKRDQLSFNYALAKNNTEWHRLMKPPYNIRNHPDLIIAPHHEHAQVFDELVARL